MSTSLLVRWDPENPAFWQAKGRPVAWRNLAISIPALMLAFIVWSLWSVVVVNLDRAGFHFGKNQLFWLTALPALSGATLRIFYSFLVPIFGGRRFTAISTATLLIPALGMGFALRDPGTGYPTLLILALLCGFGGANFSSSMANISFFFPKAKKGLATGLNAGIGNLGVSVVQFVTPLVISAGIFGALAGDPQTTVAHGATTNLWLQNAGFVWVPFIVVATFAAWFGMNDIADAKASFAEQAVIFRRLHNWLMCWLYVGTFGSFIGFSAGFALLTKALFPNVNPTAYAFIGPLAGALMRPVGGWVSDRIGGARVTFWTFAAMIAAVAGVIAFLPAGGDAGNFAGFLAMFIVLFALTGIGNGSTFRMIPVIFLTERQRAAQGQDEAAQKQALLDAGKESAAVLGFSGAIGAYGGFFIPKSFGTSLDMTGSAVPALACFIVFYVSCVAITWWFYARRNASMPC
ncbi:NarK family nitrate/nitrite MFS transporter [Burkholderia oklahomensis]|uniref:NarK family nitrate/nitrite MFS transporter n=1 Tax=Burkholderia oklahomensis TaxID=342113 RepID=UPI00016A82C6|nr:NarK family nitrate/nitrite MFS transporter [Burkholderia oklahomensis]AJX33691.1 nitrite transporter family protein [Burkholderia oklahomensis C6786]AOI45474.1 nitrate/nitrite transporter NarK [Burkholderia oklahomensis C6786]KUY57500.1 nitrate/nitrite transporter NarK [Burkholderia oklahomensis C6786]MBI0358441.1 NarK family nitrate/nitrite MFS transporter [Burkholderia oklahomensis]SUW56565.1 Nitrite facilitator 1 [Burkholderia oklahomensis]